MMNTRAAVLAGIAALALSGFAHAAGPVRTPAAVPAAQPASSAMRVIDGPVARPRRAELVVVSDIAAPSARGTWTEAPAARESFYSNAAGQPAEAKPLPGALWLFGSALLVFIGISARRRF
jgi:hypothetical protein